LEQDTILEIKNLSLGFGRKTQVTPILDKVSFSIKKNEILAVVGESGCGKSVTAMSIMRLLRTPPAQYLGGSILFHDDNLLSMPAKQLRKIRGNKISMIFQEPLTSLNPVLTIGDQVGEALSLHNKMTASEIREESIKLLKAVRIPSPESRLKNYPGQYSGGMRQRIMIAMAIACHPELLIADEPTTALDVTIQAQILKLLKQLQKESGMSIILITHDLGVVAEFAERVVVMYAGQILEIASTKELFSQPLHPYTRGLLDSLPKLNSTKDRLKTIEGSVPGARNMPKGCRFHLRCPERMPICSDIEPEMTCINGHLCKCHLISESVGK
jgi:peptide/nickel transport system ATP-binding protein/oligopeptide transport system ATP-binding protein